MEGRDVLMTHQRIGVAAVLTLVLLTFSLSVFAASKADILVRNLHPTARLEVAAYNADDWVGLISCQRLPYSTREVRYINPSTASGGAAMTHDHCGNYDRLKLRVSVHYEQDNILYDRYKFFEDVIVPWGATVTYHADDTLTCDGCAWSKKDK